MAFGGRWVILDWILAAIFGEENVLTVTGILLVISVLALVGIIFREWSVYKSRAGENASWEGFRRFQKVYPEERRHKAEARRREREARREARRREKEERKENKE